MTPSPEPVTQKPWTILSVLLFLTVAVAFWLRNPIMEAMPACKFRELTQLNCPGCGGRRCVTLLAQGRWLEALQMNALLVLLGATIAYLLLRQCWREWRSGKAAIWDLSTRQAWILVGSIIAFWILRNIPLWPLTLLSPR